MAGGPMGRLGSTGGNQMQLGQQAASPTNMFGDAATPNSPYMASPVRGGASGGLGPMGGGGKSGGGWAPAFQGGQAPQGVSAQYPQLFGGPYNQMTQQLAGPSYQQQGMPRPALAPTAQPPGGMGNPSAGAPPSLMNPGAGGWRGGYYGSQLGMQK